MNFPLNNFADMNERTFREFIKELVSEVITELPISSASQAGVVKIGQNVNILNGVISVDFSDLQTKLLENAIVINGVTYTTVEDTLDVLSTMDYYMRSPVTGQIEDLITVITDVFYAYSEALTASAYDALALTATAYDALDLTALEYDMNGITP